MASSVVEIVETTMLYSRQKDELNALEGWNKGTTRTDDSNCFSLHISTLSIYSLELIV